MDFVKVLEQQWKLVIGVLVLLLVAGGVAALVNMQSTKKEQIAQESYFAVEKQLFDLKNQKLNPTEAAKAVTKVEPAQVKAGFEKVIADYPGSVAAQMSALHLAGLLVEEKNFDSALTILQKVENKDKGLVNTLVQQQIGQLLADKDKCQDAIAVWQKIIDRKEASFIHGDTKIQQALCYTKVNDFKKAEEILTNLANQNPNPEMGNSSASKEAEKYLRLIQFKKASGT